MLCDRSSEEMSVAATLDVNFHLTLESVELLLDLLSKCRSQLITGCGIGMAVVLFAIVGVIQDNSRGESYRRHWLRRFGNNHTRQRHQRLRLLFVKLATEHQREQSG